MKTQRLVEYADTNRDCTLALQKELDQIDNGGEYYLPRGTYLVRGSLHIPRGIRLRGETNYSTILVCGKTTGDFIFLSADSQIDNLKIIAEGARHDGAFVTIVGNGARITNFVMENYAIGVWVKGIVDRPITFPVIESGNFFNPAIGAVSGMIVCENYANAVITKVIGSSGVDLIQPHFGIRLLNGDTCIISDVDIVKHRNALLIDPPTNYVVYATSISNSLFDSSVGASSAKISAENGGAVYSTKFSNCWFGISSHHGLEIEGGRGEVDGVSLSGCEFIDNKGSGLQAAGPNTRNISLTGGWSTGNGRDGVRLTDIENAVISAMLITKASGRRANQGFGLYTEGCREVAITGCIVRGNGQGEHGPGERPA